MSNPTRFHKAVSGNEFFAVKVHADRPAVIPGFTYLETARAAAVIRDDSQPVNRITHVLWSRPMVLEGQSRQLTIEVDGNDQFRLFDNDRQVVQGRLHRGPYGSVADWNPADLGTGSPAVFAHETAPALAAVRTDGSRIIADLRLPENLEADFEDYGLHPSLMEALCEAARASLPGLPLFPLSMAAMDIYDFTPMDLTAVLDPREDQDHLFDISLIAEDGFVVAEIHGLQFQPWLPGADQTTAKIQKAAESETLQGELLTFHTRWTPVAAAGAQTVSGRWLVFDQDGSVVEQLRERGAESVVLVKRGRKFIDHGDGSYTINPKNEADLDQLLDCLQGGAGLPENVWHLWCRKRFMATPMVLDSHLDKGLYTLFRFTKAMMARKADTLRLLFAYNVPEDEVEPLYAAVPAFCKSVNGEQPRFRFGTVELRNFSDLKTHALTDLLLAETAASDAEEVRLMPGEKGAVSRDEKRLVPFNADSFEARPVKAGGVYLITGGLGGLGLIFAETLAKRVGNLGGDKAKLVLTGRSALDADKKKKVAELEALGVEVLYIAADVADREQTQDLIAQTIDRFGRLDGIIHSAGVIRDAYVMKKEASQIEQVLAPKVYGTVFLDEATTDLELDFFVTFSSLVSALGNPGQSDYSYGNAFLDQFVAWREQLRQKGRRHGKAMSLCWPLWQSGGMSISDEDLRLLTQQTGIMALPTEDGIKAFDAVSENPQLLVIYGLPQRLQRYFDSRFGDAAPRFAERENEHTADAGQTDLGSVDRGQVRDRLDTLLRELLSAETRIPVEAMQDDTRFEDYGIDSIAIKNFNAKIEAELSGLGSLPKTLLFEYQTLAELNDYFLDKHLAQLGAFFTSSGSTIADPAIAGDVLLQETEAFLRGLLAAETRLPESAIQTDTRFEDYGIDSITIKSFNSKIEDVLGPLPKTLLFEYQTLAELTEYFVNHHADALVRGLGFGNSGETGEEHVPTWPDQQQIAAAPVPETLLEPSVGEDEPIAVIGIAGRYPGADSIAQFWANLTEGKDSIDIVPGDRWDAESLYDPDPKAAREGKIYCKWGGFLKDVDQFDPLFFNISPKEAEMMDPQERIFLQTAWTAFEDAGWTRPRLEGLKKEGRQVGVFVGSTTYTYNLLGAEEWQKGNYVMPASIPWTIANRVSYILNLHGPSMPVDTACSSSLTAVHLACESLRKGECGTALVGGVNLYLHPSKYQALCQAGMLSPQGRCHSFGDQADGFVPGEGVGAVVLKPLSQAQRDGDRVYALILGSAVNHGGRTHGYSVPNPKAQGDLIAEAVQRSGINAESIGYIEAHGTGTSLGDPIEIAGLTRAFRQSTDKVGYCAVGSSKSNIGHLESAAGIAGLSKLVLQLQHRRIAPSLHAETLNPDIHFNDSPFYIQREGRDWQPLEDESGNPYPLRGGISSFGAGGANAHVLLESYPGAGVVADDGKDQLFVLSARNEDRLKAYASAWLRFLEQEPDASLSDLCFTARFGREAMNTRLAAVVNSKEQLKDRLNAYLTGAKQGVFSGRMGDSPLPQGKAAQAFRQAAIQEKDLEALAQLWVQGNSFSETELGTASDARIVTAPTYPFAQERYWLPTVESGSEGTVATGKTTALETGYYTVEQRKMADAENSTQDPVLLIGQKEWIAHLERGRAFAGPVGNIVDQGAVLQSDTVVQALDQIAAREGERCKKIHLLRQWQAGGELTDLFRILMGCKAFLQKSPKLKVAFHLVVTAGDQSVYGAAAAGLARSLPLALPRVEMDVVIIDPELDQARYLGGELEADKGYGREVHIKADGRYGRFPAEYQPKTGRSPLRRGGVYLITGGMGALGRCFARRLAEDHGAKLVLVGRSQIDPSRFEDFRDQIRALGGDAAYQTCDIADAEAVVQIVAFAQKQFGALHGIIHAAGTVGDLTLTQKDEQQFAATLAPKVEGTLNLDRATADLDLDLFVLFSSTASILGDFGQCDYAAGNRFMDRFAEQRRQMVAKGLRSGRTLSVNWPLWREGGMHGDAESEALYLKSSGMALLSEQIGYPAFETMLAGEAPQIAVIHGDRNRVRRFLELDKAVTATQTIRKKIKRKKAAGDGDQPLETRLLKDLQARAAAILRLEAQRLDIAENLGDFGFDSLGLKDLADEISEAFTIDITPSVFFAHSSIKALTNHLLEEYRDQVEQAMPAAGDDQEEIWEEVEIQVPVAVESGQETDAVAPPMGNEPIAVIGMSGAYPQADDLDVFWQNLVDQRDCITEIPAERWDWRDFFGEPGSGPNRSKSKWGGFINDVDKFDPKFFKISPIEAELMDPQHRLFILHCWKAVEDAGYRMSELSGRRVGVYVGVQFNDYGDLIAQMPDIKPQIATGTAHAMLANRVSYLFNWHGPSESIDTACSSGLVALHQAVRSLRSGESELAVAGGVSLVLAPFNIVGAGQLGILSPDGRCKTFDQSANGYVKGEGLGSLLLKPLSAAERDGDPIYAVIRGTAVNHGGKANSLTAPNPEAQASLLVDAYREAGYGLETNTYYEAHGTGTELGDPVEIEGMKKALRTLRGNRDGVPEGTCAVSSVKTNIGHLEPASGIAGLMKVILAMHHKKQPGTVHFQNLNPYIKFEKTPFFILDQTRDWQPLMDETGNPVPRRAGVSSFGFGGANAHVAVEEYQSAQSAVDQAGKQRLFVFSARNQSSLTDNLSRWRKFLERGLAAGEHNHRQARILDIIAGILSVKAEDLDLGSELSEIGLDQVAMAELERRLVDTYPDIQIGKLNAETLGQLLGLISDTGGQLGLTEHLPTLRDISFTLAFGREAMSTRIAVVAEDHRSLLNALHAYLNELEHRGLFLKAEDIAEDGPLADAARLWLAGEEPDFQTLFQGENPSRVHLPSYQFAKERYWLSNYDEIIAHIKRGQGGATVVTHKHPLVGANHSDFYGFRYRATLSADQWFLRDHVVENRVVLPGVAYLEAVRAAASEAESHPVTRVENVLWAAPMTMEGQAREIEICLEPDQQGAGFEVRDTASELVFAQGRVSFDPVGETANLDLDQLLKETDGVWQKDQVYAAFRSRGLDYGPAFQAITELHHGETCSIARLELPESAESGETWILPPSLLDGAFQTALGFSASGKNKQALIPFALETLLIHQQPGTRCWAVVRKRTSEGKLQKLDIQLCDEQGRILVEMRGLNLRAVGKADLAAYRQTYVDAEAQGSAFAGRLLIIAERGTDAKKIGKQLGNIQIQICSPKNEWGDLHGALFGEQPDLAAAAWQALQNSAPVDAVLFALEKHEPAPRAVFRLAKAVMADKKHKAPACLYLYQHDGQDIAAALALDGMFRTLRLENPAFRWGLLGIDAETELGTALPLELSRLEYDIRYLARSRQRAALVQVEPVEEGFSYRSGGAYLISGGLGGLGLIFARHLADQGPVKLALLARGPLNAERAMAVADLEAKGAQVRVFQADVGDLDQLLDVVAEASKDFGGLTGVIHAAGVLRDAFLFKKEESDFNQVLAAKVRGTRNLDTATADQKLDFFVCFSSSSAVLGNPGQVDYAYGNRFMDHFMAARNRQVAAGERSGRSRSINWPLWADGGMSVDDATRHALASQFGMTPLSTAAGLKAFDQTLAGEYDQLMILQGDLGKLQRTLIRPWSIAPGSVPGKSQSAPTVTEGKSSDNAVAKARKHLTEIVADITKTPIGDIEPEEALENYGIDSVMITALNRELEAGFGPLSKTLFFEYQTIAALADYFVENFPNHWQAETAPAVTVSTAATTTAPVAKTGVTVDLDGAVRDLLKNIVAKVTKTEIDSIEADEALENYGIDSVMITVLNRELEAIFGALSKTLFFEYQTIAALSGYFMENHRETLTAKLGAGEQTVAGSETGSMETAGVETGDTSNESKPRRLIRGGERVTAPVEGGVPEDDRIAIIGFSGYYPQSPDMYELWQNLVNRRDCITEIPGNRWDWRKAFNPDKNAANGVYSKWGGFIDGHDQFDAKLFRITPREAEVMDPQERKFLEVVYRALEDAGYGPRRLETRELGVFCGVMYGEYQFYGFEETLKNNMLYASSSYASIANRISYIFNFSGPSFSVDSMCSSSLTTLHLAINAIRRGECKMAVAGGVNLNLHSQKYVTLSKGRFAASDGRCKSYGAGGDGYVPSEGVGAIILKPLSQAEKDGDRIDAVILATDLGHDGKTNGYSVPNPVAQADVLGRALKKANIDARTISYIEGHGTGTSLGDPIEITGLSRAFKPYDVPVKSVALGSVKSNMGHAESAASISGITKVLLQMRYKTLVPSIHSDTLNPNIDFDNLPFVVQRTLEPWQPRQAEDGRLVRRAVVNSFGAGGSNSAIILEDYDDQRVFRRYQGETLWVPLSATDSDQLRLQAQALLSYLERDERPENDLLDLAYTLQAGREQRAERVCFKVDSIEKLKQDLATFIQGTMPVGARFGNRDDLPKAQRPKDDPEALLAQGDWDRIGEIWVKGIDIPWGKAYQNGPKPKIESLPGYIFAKKRYWVNQIDKAIGAGAKPALHPLLDENRGSFLAQKFVKNLSTNDFFMRDHVVAGNPMLPGVAYLEMARAAGRIAAEMEPVALVDATFKKPVQLEAGQEENPITIELEADGTIVRYQVISQGAGRPVVHADGTLVYDGDKETPATIDLQALRARCGAKKRGDDLYRKFIGGGLAYGAGFQTIRELYRGEDVVIARLSLSEEVQGHDGFVLHPSLMDGAFQSVIGFADRTRGKGTFLPYKLDRLTWHQPLGDEVWVVVRPREDAAADNEVRYDIAVTDAEGRTAVAFDGLTLRALPGSAVPADLLYAGYQREALTAAAVGRPDDLLLFADVATAKAFKAAYNGPLKHVAYGESYENTGADSWRVNAASGDQLALLLADLGNRLPADVLVLLPNDEKAGKGIVFQALAMFQAWMRVAVAKKTRFTFAFQHKSANSLNYRALVGCFNTLTLENPNFQAKLVEVREAAWPQSLVDSLLDESRYLILDGNRRERVQVATMSAPSNSKTLPLTKGGTYLITGGLGGLGLIFAEMLAEQLGANLVLTGRGAMDDNKAERIRDLETLGAKVLYHAADVSKADHVTELIETAKARFGSIHGVIHSAGVLRDGMLMKKSREQVAEVLAPKREALHFLDEATADQPLDCFVVFSSMSGALGNPGQFDYTYANRYMDAFIQQRAQEVKAGTRKGRSLSLGWPLWAEGGMQLDAATIAAMTAQTGMVPLDTDLGREAFAAALNGNEPYYLVTQGRAAKMKAVLFGEGNWVEEKPPVAKPVVAAPVKAVGAVASPAPAASSGADLRTLAETYLKALIAKATKLAPGEIRAKEAFESLGMDSVMIMDVTRELESAFGALPKTLFFEYQSLGELTTYFLEQQKDQLTALLGYQENVETGDETAAAPVAAATNAATSAASSFDLQRASEDYLKGLIAKATKLAPGEIRAKEAFESLGMDSVMIMDVTRELESVFGALPKTLFFEYQSLAELTTYFMENQKAKLTELLGESASAPVAGTPAQTLEAPIQTPSSEEPVGVPAFLERAKNAKGSGGYRPVAIIGIAGTYPRARDLDAFWDVLKQGVDCIQEVPEDRWDYKPYYDPEERKPGRMVAKWGGFIDHPDHFDPFFFNISPRDAVNLDPQERLFLSTAYHTVENAGYTKSALKGKKVAVYAGVMWNQYPLFGYELWERDGKTVTSGSISSIANRISYWFDWTGPSMGLDTMCSSSLTALHLGCRAIQNGEAEMAVAGGVNVLPHPYKYVQLSAGAFLAEDGRCRAFGADGTGYVPGEGVGAVMLKPLDKAIEDGDYIYGVVKSTAINHGGKTNGYTVPNPIAQSKLIAEALQTAKISAGDIDYIEAHGTGTSLGDPIELNGIDRAYEPYKPEKGSIPIGSVKSNIGHLEASAGVAGLHKILLQMQHRTLVPSLHAETLNPNLDFSRSAIRVQRVLEPWQPKTTKRFGRVQVQPLRAGLSSFGAGGSNMHVIVEEGPVFQPSENRRGPFLFVLSALNKDRLKAYASRFLAFLEQKKETRVSPEVRKTIADILNLDPDHLPMDEPWAELGLEPVRLSELARALSEKLNRGVGAAELSDLGTPAAVEAALAGKEHGTGQVTIQAPFPLADITYTLQVGREAMNNRLAVVVNSAADLHAALNAFLNGNEGSVHIGDAKKDRGGLDMLLEGAAGEAFLNVVLDSGDLEKLARLWSRGLDFEWSLIHRRQGGPGRRVPLPGYPFEEISYRLPKPDRDVPPPSGRGPAASGGGNAKPVTAPQAAYAQPQRQRAVLLHPVWEPISDSETQSMPDGRLLILCNEETRELSRKLFPARADQLQFGKGGDLKAENAETTRSKIEAYLDQKGSPVAVIDLADLHDQPQRRVGHELGKIAAVQALVKGAKGRPMRYLHFTQGHADDGALPSLAGAPRTGLIRSLRAEYKQIFAKTIDIELALNDDASWVRILERELNLIDAVSAVSLRGERRLRLAFHERMPQNDPVVAIRPDKTYVVTGGTRGIGSAVAAHLVQRGARKLVLMGVSPLPPREHWDAVVAAGEKQGHIDKILFVRDLEGRGAQVDVYAGLLSNEMELREYFNGIRERFAPIAGVVHCAGLIDSHAPAFIKKPMEAFEQVFEPKIAGLQTLDKVLADDPLDFFVLFSSVSGSVPGLATGVTPYAAANAFMDQYARFRHGSGRAVYRSLIWPNWTEIGMGQVTIPLYEQLHLGGLPTREGIELLDASLGIKEPVLLPAVIREPGFDGSLLTLSRPQDQLAPAVASAPATKHAPAAVKTVNLASKTPAGDDMAWVRDVFKEELMIPDERLDGDTLFGDFGVDSVLLADLVQKIEARLKVSLDPSILLEYPTLNQLQTYLRETYGGTQVEAEAGTMVETETVASAGDSMATVDQFLEDLFNRELMIPRERLDRDTNFGDFGVDSVLLADLVTHIESWLETKLDPSILLEYPSMQALAEYLAENFRIPGSGPAQTKPAATQASVKAAPLPATPRPETPRPATPRPAAPQPATPQPAAPIQGYRSQAEAVDGLGIYQPQTQTASVSAQPRPYSGKVAVIGMACRLPKADNVGQYWQNLVQGLDCVTEIPPERWNKNAYYSPNGEENTSISKWGAFVDGIEYFDPKHFGFSEEEAAFIDPLMRLSLEVGVQTFRHAGYEKRELSGRKVGVYIGSRMANYGARIERFTKNSVVGFGQNFIGAHLSHHLNLKGPNMVIDSACSSSLVTIHLACQSLLLGETEMALAGGVDILLDEQPYLALSAGKALSPDGKCHTFDEKANGFVPGEGAGAVLLKPLEKAVEDGDRIYAVIEATAVNNDGRTMGMTTPNPEAQAAVIREAQQRGNINPATIGLIETHGTGTMIGDPIELKALTKVFREGTDQKGFCAVGSVKTNMGHALSAAGVAGFIKLVLSLHNRTIPPTLHCEKPNPRFKFDDSPFYPVTSARNWEAVQGVRRAGISSFGFGGTNAHIILGDFQAATQPGYREKRQSLPPENFDLGYYWLKPRTRVQEGRPTLDLELEDDEYAVVGKQAGEAREQAGPQAAAGNSLLNLEFDE